MKRLACFWALTFAALLATGCNKHGHKKHDPAKGTVTGIVICKDTGKPARFATITLSAAPDKRADAGDKDEDLPLPASESGVTDLNGRFVLEAVDPGTYYAFATQEGYLDPLRGLDLTAIHNRSGQHAQHVEAVGQWKDHLLKVSVAVGHTSEISIFMERAAEITGTVTFDDSSPAIGMHFELLRKTANATWAPVGMALFDDWTIRETSNSWGRFALTNLIAGEYKVCALLPGESQESAQRVCAQNTFRSRDAKTFTVQSGESVTGVDIVVPLNALHTVAGAVIAFSDGHPLPSGHARLLYADDHALARVVPVLEDGSFSFADVPEGEYLLEFVDVKDAAKSEEEEKQSGSNTNAKPVATYVDQQLPLSVRSDQTEIQVRMKQTPPAAKTN